MKLLRVCLIIGWLFSSGFSLNRTLPLEETIENSVFLPILFNSYPPPIEILPNYSMTNNSGSINMIGEMVNHTAQSVRVSAIIIDTFDLNGSFIKTRRLSEFSRLQLTSETSFDSKTCFSISVNRELRADPEIASFQIKSIEHEPISALDLIPSESYIFVNSIMYPDYVIEGYIQNNSVHKSIYTRIIRTFYNQDGRVVNCSATYAFTEPLPPQGISAFSVDHYDYWSIEVPHSFRLQANGYWGE